MVAGSNSGADALMAMSKATEGRTAGALQAGDKLYDRLLLWVDRNHNGVSEAGELRLARELFTGIGMGFLKIDRRDAHGNRYWLQGWTEVRTSGAEQGPATDPRDHFPRVRQMFEAYLAGSHVR